MTAGCHADLNRCPGFFAGRLIEFTMAKRPRRSPSATTRSPRAARTPGAAGAARSGGASESAGASAAGKHLVIVESPTKAKTINKYLGSDYKVMASVGHVRDLPSRAPKGTKQPVPGVDLENDFAPTYEVMPDKKKTISDLKKAARTASDVWFATDLDREGEAIAWHLAQALDVPVGEAKRVVFNAITRNEIQHAFSNPRHIDEAKVNAQQARRILDRIVGYQVSPLLWKKVAGGLSAGRVQSVAVRLVVEREREIEAFIPQEYWRLAGYFATDLSKTSELSQAWQAFVAGTGPDEEAEPVDAIEDAATPRTNDRTERPDRKGLSMREKLAWLSQRQCLRGEMVEFQGKPFDPTERDTALHAARAMGFIVEQTDAKTDPKAKGTAQNLVQYRGQLDLQASPQFTIASIQTKRTSTRPYGPFITSTLQQQASIQLGFGLQRTMRLAQQLYEGVDLRGSEGQTGLITYMRTDSTHLSGEALNMARSFIAQQFGEKYLPEKPNFFASSNKAAQEAHEAIRPTDVSLTPARVRHALNDEQFKLYDLIWKRFVACQMMSAQWDATTINIAATPRGQAQALAMFRATGRTLVFDGFYKVVGVPGSGDEAVLPALREKQTLGALNVDPTQHFTTPPPRYNEASLQKKLEEEGIGRPSTYAAIISTIQDRKYVQQLAPRDRRMYATDLGKVVTDKLIQGFPKLMDLGFTREMESELDKIEEEQHDWVQALRDFYGPFKDNLEHAMETMTHAKAEITPAPYKCAKCGAETVYRFGRNGRFLSCSRYPDCDYAAPIDREGNPQPPERVDILCPICASDMNKRSGRFGSFLGCVNYPTCKGIVKLDPKKHTVVLPKVLPLLTDLPCPKCAAPLNMRQSKRGPWLSCSKFPKCRGRLAWSAVPEPKQKELEAALHAHEAANPVPILRTRSGQVVAEGYVPASEGEAVAGVE